MEHAKEMRLTAVLASDEAAQRQLYTTYLASMFRSLRFGLTDAHGKGMAIQFNYLTDKGAFTQSTDGTFAVNLEKFKQAVRDLDHDLLTLEAEGDYAGAKKMQDELGVVRPALRRALDNLQGIPTDIEPIFVTADELAPAGHEQAAAARKSKGKRKEHSETCTGEDARTSQDCLKPAPGEDARAHIAGLFNLQLSLGRRLQPSRRPPAPARRR